MNESTNNPAAMAAPRWATGYEEIDCGIEWCRDLKITTLPDFLNSDEPGRIVITAMLEVTMSVRDDWEPTDGDAVVMHAEPEPTIYIGDQRMTVAQLADAGRAMWEFAALLGSTGPSA